MRLGRFTAWVAVALLLVAAAASVVALIDVSDPVPRGMLVVAAIAVAWLALGAVPLALLAAMVVSRLRSRRAPRLWGPAGLLVVAAGGLWRVHGAWLLLPAGALLIAATLFEVGHRLRDASGSTGAAEGVAADL